MRDSVDILRAALTINDPQPVDVVVENQPEEDEIGF